MSSDTTLAMSSPAKPLVPFPPIMPENAEDIGMVQSPSSSVALPPAPAAIQPPQRTASLISQAATKLGGGSTTGSSSPSIFSARGTGSVRSLKLFSLWEDRVVDSPVKEISSPILISSSTGSSVANGVSTPLPVRRSSKIHLHQQLHAPGGLGPSAEFGATSPLNSMAADDANDTTSYSMRTSSPSRTRGSSLNCPQHQRPVSPSGSMRSFDTRSMRSVETGVSGMVSGITNMLSRRPGGSLHVARVGSTNDAASFLPTHADGSGTVGDEKFRLLRKIHKLELEHKERLDEVDKARKEAVDQLKMWKLRAREAERDLDHMVVEMEYQEEMLNSQRLLEVSDLKARCRRENADLIALVGRLAARNLALHRQIEQLGGIPVQVSDLELIKLGLPTEIEPEFAQERVFLQDARSAEEMAIEVFDAEMDQICTRIQDTAEAMRLEIYRQQYDDHSVGGPLAGGAKSNGLRTSLVQAPVGISCVVGGLNPNRTSSQMKASNARSHNSVPLLPFSLASKAGRKHSLGSSNEQWLSLRSAHNSVLCEDDDEDITPTASLEEEDIKASISSPVAEDKIVLRPTSALGNASADMALETEAAQLLCL